MPFLFPRKQEVLELHARLIEEFGGSHGLRDEGALESALVAAEHREYYEQADLATCAATYAYHLTKRTPLLMATSVLRRLFLKSFLKSMALT